MWLLLIGILESDFAMVLEKTEMSWILQVKTETALENHVKSHSGIRDLKCHLCDATFASRYTLNAHVKRHAITEPLFSCQYCGKGSKSKANLDQHIRIHTGVRPYSCNVCNAASVTLLLVSFSAHH